MAAAQEFDPFFKVSGELLISDLLNALMVLANFIQGGISMNKRAGDLVLIIRKLVQIRNTVLTCLLFELTL